MNPILSEAELERELLRLCREIVHPTIEPTTQLVAEGLLDSFHTLRLASAIEDTFGVSIDLASLGVEDVESVVAMTHYVQAKLQSTP